MNMLNILLVEDEESDVVIIKHTLSKVPIATRVVSVTNGEDAYLYLTGKGQFADKSRQKIDLVLLDLNMIRLNGFEFLELVKQDPQLKILPVIVLTSSSRDQDVENAYRLGANSYVTKPIEVEEFTTKIGQIIHYWTNICRLPS